MPHRLLESDPPRRCVTEKLFSAGEPLLESSSAVPASLVVEALCQSAAFLSAGGVPERGRIVRIEESEVSGVVRPGDRLVVTALLLEEAPAALKAECLGKVDGAPVARVKVLVQRDPGRSHPQEAHRQEA
jgi:3-hydroxymyristoyl/3-hydroxydecanoyl-(acyl carrier protein) dehydratase